MALLESLGAETMQQVNDFARKKQVAITVKGSDTSTKQSELNEQLERFRRTQLRLDLIEQLKDMLSIVTFLEQNTIESGKVIFDEMTLKELAETTYDEIIAVSTSVKTLDALKPVPQITKEKIGSLLSSKEMNPASFFSFSFKVGVYLPILSPFTIPILLTLGLILRRKLYLMLCKKKE